MKCQCGCGEETKPANRFIYGHSLRQFHSTENHPNWNGGRKIVNGYVKLWKPDHPYSDHRGYVAEHRLMMEDFLGRYLEPEEIAHHVDEIRHHNEIKNLELCLFGIHIAFHKKGNKNCLGKKLSPEHKVKLSQAAKGRKHSPETKTKISAIMRGKWPKKSH